MYQRLMKDNVVPLVPIILNVHTPPNQPTPRRLYEFGRAVRTALEAWDDKIRVAVIATGGLSVGIVDEELDRAALSGMQSRDLSMLATLPRTWMQGSQGEVLCWIATAGAVEHLEMEILDYIPGYRSPAATGCGLAFARWM
jgi:3-O-methylgallate 3,4-dioxygenase